MCCLITAGFVLNCCGVDFWLEFVVLVGVGGVWCGYICVGCGFWCSFFDAGLLCYCVGLLLAMCSNLVIWV